METEVADTLAIVKVMSKYGTYWDGKDLEGVLSLMTDDVRTDYGVFGAYEGKDEVVGYAKPFFAGETAFQDWFHVFTNPWIEIDGDRARGRWNFLGTYVFEEVGAAWLVGRYDNTFRKVAGDWKFSEITLEFKYVSPYDEGWAEVPMAPELVE